MEYYNQKYRSKAKFMRKFIMCTVASLLLASTNSTIVPTKETQVKKKWPPAGTLNEEGNLIKNGQFNFPQIQSDYQITNNLPGWTANQVERGIGSIYNSNWGNVVVVELDGNQNNVMKQSLSLDSGQYILSFKWAGRNDYLTTSGMSVYWNNKKIFQILAKDNLVHEQIIPIQVRQSGNFLLEFRGEGPSDSLGMTLAHLRLRRDQSKPKPLPLPPARPFIEEGNLIKNGHFNFPQIQSDYQVTNNLPGWASNQVQRGIGSLYNSNWGNVVVVQLDGNQNNVMKQSLSLDPGYYNLCFKWAARNQFISTSGMSVFWNNKKIFEVTANDNLVHEQVIPIQVLQPGNFVLQFKGEGASDSYGMTIANLRLSKDLSKQIRPLPPAGPLTEQGNYIKNGNFNHPQMQAEFEIHNNLPAWKSDELERGVGRAYNQKWGNIVVAELDGYHNDNLKQSLSLKGGYYILCFKWAARTNYVASSAMSIYWNNQKIFEVAAKDDSIHSERIPIFVPHSGDYVLQIRGEGQSDTYGMTVTNFRLTKDESKKLKQGNKQKDEYFPEDELFPEDKKKKDVQIGSTRY